MQNEVTRLRKQVSEQWQHIKMCRVALEQLATMFQNYCQLHDVEHQENQESIQQELLMLHRALEHQEELLHQEVNVIHEQFAAIQRQRRVNV